MPAQNPGNADTVLRQAYDRDTGTLKVVATSDSLTPGASVAQNPGNADEVLRQVYDRATGAMKVSGVASSPLSGAGAPTSGAAGVQKGTLYLDTSFNPNVVYINVGTDLVSSWMGLLSGAVIP